VTTVRGITSTVNFFWSSNGTVLKEEDKYTEDFTLQNLDIYIDTYIISPLSVFDDGRIYQCEVLIETSPPVTASDNVTLNVTGMQWYVFFTVSRYSIFYSSNSSGDFYTIWSYTRSYGR